MGFVKFLQILPFPATLIAGRGDAATAATAVLCRHSRAILDYMGFVKFLQILPFPATLIAGRGDAAIGVIALTLIILFCCWILKKKERLPPGPCPWPIIGNLHQLRLPVHRTLKQLADKYGAILFLRFGSVSTVVVSSSEMAKEFLKTHDLLFASRPPTSAGKYFFYNFKDIATAPYGDHWRKMRKICVLELLTAKRIESFKHVREEEVSAMIRSIWEDSESGRIPVNVSKAISGALANILWRILASKKFSDDDLGADGKGFRDLVLEVSEAVGSINIGDFIPYLDWLDLQGIKRRLMKSNSKFDAFAENMIDEHVNYHMAEAAAEAEAEPQVKDTVDVLLEMVEIDNTETKITRKTIKALLFQLFAAGSETSADALEWAMSELLRHPDAITRLQEEIESVVGQHGRVKESNLASMVYLKCVVKETLRLYPSLPLALPHASVEAVRVGGYYIPKRTMVIMNVWAIGRDPKVWGADASEFKPERFMQVEEHGVDFTGGQTDFKMLPFGAGRRGCPGSAMAIMTVEFALAQLVHTFDWKVEGDPSKLDMKEACGTTMARQVPLFAYPRLRLPT